MGMASDFENWLRNHTKYLVFSLISAVIVYALYMVFKRFIAES